MFTGIIEEMGRVAAFVQNKDVSRLAITAETVMTDLKTGESVTVNGACMTALDLTATGFSCDVSPETLSLTNLGGLKPGDRVNLERAMKMNDRLGGHMVSGHVEGVGKIVEKRPLENGIFVTLELPRPVLKYCVPKGSITLDGVSMTLNQLSEKGVTICIIPHTAEMTTLGFKDVGDVVNLESDLIGRYVERLLQGGAPSPYTAQASSFIPR